MRGGGEAALAVVAQHVGYVSLDANAVKALLGVNREVYGLLAPVAVKVVEEGYRRVAPGVLELLELYGSPTFMQCDIDVVGMLNVLNVLDEVYHRQKGDRYKHKLEPLINGSLLRATSVDIQDAEARDVHVKNGVVFLCCCIAYVHQRYFAAGIHADRVPILHWFMFAFYDYVLYLYQAVECELLCNSFFRMLMIMGMEKVRNDRRSMVRFMGPARTYALERVLQKLECAMWRQEDE